jgi:hypothetical protein
MAALSFLAEKNISYFTVSAPPSLITSYKEKSSGKKLTEMIDPGGRFHCMSSCEVIFLIIDAALEGLLDLE